MAGWFSLPDMGIDVRQGDDGGYWRHTERIPDPVGEGPYETVEDAARDGQDYANFVHGR